ncbi:MAG: type II secretion system F family protein [Candidatus Diapherotrites archaeon]
MDNLEALRKTIEEKKEVKKEPKRNEEVVDMAQVEKIVERMKKKYRQQGVVFQKAEGDIEELREIIATDEQEKISLQRVEDLEEFRSPLIAQLGRFYISFRKVLEPIVTSIQRIPIASQIRYNLYSANMKLSLVQWLAISTSITTIIAFLVFVNATAFTIVFELPIFFPVIITFFVTLLVMLVMLLIPKSAAQKRGLEVTKELPFALRHMSTEIKAGIGLYKSLQTVASSDYGVLSEEFGRTIAEIEEGTDTKDALRHFALRTYSKPMKNSLFHIIRAMKTGGSLSEIMNIIAEDVSFDTRVRIKEFSEKLNFFGVIFIFAAIVVPVFIAVLGAVTNSPVSLGGLVIPSTLVLIAFFVIMPGLLGILVFYLKMTQPEV